MSEYSLLSLPTDMFVTLASFLTSADLASVLWCHNRALNRLFLQRGVIRSISLKATDFLPTQNDAGDLLPDSLLDRCKLIYMLRSLNSLKSLSFNRDVSEDFRGIHICISDILGFLPSDLEKLSIFEGGHWYCRETIKYPIPPYWKKVIQRPTMQLIGGFGVRGQSTMLPTSTNISLPQTRSMCYQSLQLDFMNHQVSSRSQNGHPTTIFVFDISKKFPNLQHYLTYSTQDSTFQFASEPKKRRLCDFADFIDAFPKTLKTLEVPVEKHAKLPTLLEWKQTLPSSLTCLRLQQTQLNLSLSDFSQIINNMPDLVEVCLPVERAAGHSGGTEILSITSPSIKTVRLDINFISNQLEVNLSPNITSLTIRGIHVSDIDKLFGKIVKQVPRLTMLELSGNIELSEESFHMFPQSLTHLSILAPNFGKAKFDQPAPTATFAPAAAATTFGQPAPSFAFGQPASTATFGQPASTATFGQPAPSFSFGQPAPSFSFGQPAPSFSFGQPATSSTSFGQPATSSTSLGQPAPSGTFGQPASTATFGQPAPSFSFGQPASSSTSFGQPASSSTFGFGQPASSSSSSFAQPASSSSASFGFGQPASSSSSSFGQAAPTFSPPSLYGDFASASLHFQHLPKGLKYYCSVSANIRDVDLSFLPSGLKTLILENAQLTNSCIEHIPSNLTELYLSQSKITEDVIDHIPTSIKSLVIEGENWTDYGIWRLWKKQPIHFQILSGARITGQLLPEGVEYLGWKEIIKLTKSALPDFLHQQLYYCRFPPTPVGNLNLIYKHKNRVVPYNIPGRKRPSSPLQLHLPSSLKTLELISYFSEFQFYYTDLNSFNSLMLPLPPSLTRLRIQTSAVETSAIFDHLPATLEHLTLYPAVVSGSDLRLLPQNLKTLVIWSSANGYAFGPSISELKSSISPEQIAQLPKSLRVFVFEEALSNECIAQLPLKLEVLGLPNARLNAEHLGQLPKSLKKLYLASTSLTEEASLKLQDLRLEDLSLGELSPEAVPNLPKTLKHLWIANDCDQIWSNLPPSLSSIVVPIIHLNPKMLSTLDKPTVLSLDTLKAAFEAKLPPNLEILSSMKVRLGLQKVASNSDIPSDVDQLDESEFEEGVGQEVGQSSAMDICSDVSEPVDRFQDNHISLELNSDNLQYIPTSVEEVDLMTHEKSVSVLMGTAHPLTTEQASILETESKNPPVQPTSGFGFFSHAGSSTKTTFELISSLSTQEQLDLIFPRINFSNLPSSVTKLKIPSALHPEDYGTLPPTLTDLNIMIDCSTFWNHIPKTIKKFGTKAPTTSFNLGDLLSNLPSHLEEFTLFEHVITDGHFSAMSPMLPASLKCLRLPGAVLNDNTISSFPNTLKLLQIKQFTFTLNTLKEIKNMNFSHPKIRLIGQTTSFSEDLEILRHLVNIPEHFPDIEAETIRTYIVQTNSHI